MKRIPILVVAASAAVAFTGALVTTHALTQPAPTGQVRSAVPAARTAFPGLSAASSEPQLPSLTAMHPAARTATQAPGPFDDRFTVTGLAFDGHQVSGTVRITSDVSEILEFEALAGFYDAGGRLLGTGRFTHHQTEADTAHQHTGPPTEEVKFTIAVPEKVRGAVAAAVGVPVLVNE